jgi:hypothetical protein
MKDMQGEARETTNTANLITGESNSTSQIREQDLPVAFNQGNKIAF